LPQLIVILLFLSIKKIIIISIEQLLKYIAK